MSRLPVPGWITRRIVKRADSHTRPPGNFFTIQHLGFKMNECRYAAANAQKFGTGKSEMLSRRMHVEALERRDLLTVADFGLVDVNPTSDTYDTSVSPRDYMGQVSGYYFGHST